MRPEGKSQTTVGKWGAFVPQESEVGHLSALRSHEYLWYSMRSQDEDAGGEHRDSISPEEKNASDVKQLRDLEKQFQLDTVGDTAIVHSKGGLSGGQKRRLLVASTVGHSDLWVLDEPFSGLDEYSSIGLLDYFRGRAENDGKAILMSLHTPSMEMLSKFDRIIAMDKGGETS